MPGSVSTTIVNDDTGLLVSVAEAEQFEGNGGPRSYTFTITRAGILTGTATVQYVVEGWGDYPASADDFADGVFPGGTLTFLAGETVKTITVAVIRTGDISEDVTLDWAVSGAGVDGADFVGGTLPSGTVTILARQTRATITVYVAGDTVREANEGFAVTLSNPSAGAIAVARATSLIENDDGLDAPLAMPQFDIVAVSGPQLEGDSETTISYVFTITRTGDLSSLSSVEWSVLGDAVNPAAAADFGSVLPHGTLIFNPGEAVQTIVVAVNGDMLAEPDERFIVTLANAVGAGIGSGIAEATILDDDPVPHVSIVDAELAQLEGNFGTTAFTFTFAVTRTGGTGSTSFVNWRLGHPGTDSADFSGTTRGRVDFAVGEITEFITITDNDNATFDGGAVTATFTGGGQASGRLIVVGSGDAASNWIGVSGSDVLWDADGAGSGVAVVIGTLSGGTDAATPLSIALNGNAVPAAVQALIRQIAFANGSDDPVGGAGGIRTVSVDVRNGAVGAAITQTATGLFTNTVLVTPENDAPAIDRADGSTILGTVITEWNGTGTHTNGGDTVVALVALLGADARDADNRAGGVGTPTDGLGLAVTGVLNTDGRWPYSTGGTTWTDIPPGTSATAALLLNPTDRVRFVPTALFNGDAGAQLTLKLWDRTGTDTTADDANIADGDRNKCDTDQFSGTTVVLTARVSAVNDAPVNMVPTTPTGMREDAAFTFSGSNAFSIADIDVNENPDVANRTLTITLTAQNGVLTLGDAASRAGVAFTSGDGVADATVTATGLSPARGCSGPATGCASSRPAISTARRHSSESVSSRTAVRR